MRLFQFTKSTMLCIILFSASVVHADQNRLPPPDFPPIDGEEWPMPTPGDCLSCYSEIVEHYEYPASCTSEDWDFWREHFIQCAAICRASGNEEASDNIMAVEDQCLDIRQPERGRLIEDMFQ